MYYGAKSFIITLYFTASDGNEKDFHLLVTLQPDMKSDKIASLECFRE